MLPDEKMQFGSLFPEGSGRLHCKSQGSWTQLAVSRCVDVNKGIGCVIAADLNRMDPVPTPGKTSQSESFNLPLVCGSVSDIDRSCPEQVPGATVLQLDLTDTDDVATLRSHLPRHESAHRQPTAVVIGGSVLSACL